MKSLHIDGLLKNIRDSIRKFMGELKPGDELEVGYTSLYTMFDVINLLEEYGVRFICKQDNKLIFSKPRRQERWEYAFKEKAVSIDPSWRCLDIGSGRNPWPRADVILDVYKDFSIYALPHQKFEIGTVCERLPFQDKEFDFVTCFHVLEHVSDPVAAAKEISRVSKRGLVECPHPVKEGMLCFQETDHRWYVFSPSVPGGPLLFKKIDLEMMGHLEDSEARAAAERLYLDNTDLMGDKAILRNYFSRCEAKLNTIHTWEGSFEIKLLE